MSINWDSVTDEATQVPSAYVRIDSSHPLGRTVETAQLFVDRLAAEGIDERLSIANLRLGTRIVHDTVRRVAAADPTA